MRKLFFALLMLCAAPVFAQEITDENYRREDDLLWKRYDRKELGYDEALRQSIELAEKYSTTPSGFERLFMSRMNIPKERLRAAYESVPEELRMSQTGKNILAFLEAGQIDTGDRYHDFEAVTDGGEPFRLSQLEGKDVLLIYGGLGCMGRNINMWNNIYAATSRDDFEIVVLSRALDAEGLRQERVNFPNDFIIVGDFLGEGSPGKIVYGAQATPTYVFIGRDGIVRSTTAWNWDEGADKMTKVIIAEVLGGDATLMRW